MKKPISSPMEPILVYQTADDLIRVAVRMDGKTVCLTQEQITQLSGRAQSVIAKHIGNVCAEGELPEESNVQILHIAGSDKSLRGTQFRIWSTQL